MIYYRGAPCADIILGVPKLTRSGLKWGFGEGLLKAKFAFFEARKSPIPKKRKLYLQNANLYNQKGALFKNPFKLDRVSFSTPDHVPGNYTHLPLKDGSAA